MGFPTRLLSLSLLLLPFSAQGEEVTPLPTQSEDIDPGASELLVPDENQAAPEPLKDIEADEAEEGWTILFQGGGMTGWEAAENPTSWSVDEDGLLVVHGNRSHLFWVGEEGAPPQWTDFDLELEVRTHEHANSGVFFHTEWQPKGWPSVGIEAQINATHADSIKTGSLYNLANVNQPGHLDDKWFNYRISVRGKRVQLAVDGAVVNDWTEPAGVDRLGAGTIALQGHDPNSLVEFRSIRIRTEDLPPLAEQAQP